MGFSPREVDAMSLWEFHAAADGYLRANGAAKAAAPSADEFDRALYEHAAMEAAAFG
jgi:hypothetical protein